MPSTSVYGLPYESPPNPQVNAEPGISLHGGSAGGEDILAKAVETELERIDGDVADLQTEVARGWKDIITGELITFDTGISVNIPPGEYDLLQLYMRGSLSQYDRLTIRVNNDDTSELHRQAWTERLFSDGSVEDSGANEVTVWTIAAWGTAQACNAQAVIYNTSSDVIMGYEASGVRQGNAANRTTTVAGGDLADNRLLSSIRFGTAGGSTSASFRLWIQGHVDES